jgi:hypothetical protein
MANSTPSRPGQDQLSGDALALMLELFGGEVLTAFQTNVLFRDKHQVKTLSKGKLFKFPAIWRTTAGYHTPGVEITGNQIAHTEITVSPDDKMISSVFVSDIDEVLNHYDVRAPYAAELGSALARAYDKQVSRTILRAARSGALFTGDTGGSILTNSDYATDASALFDGISLAKETLDGKDVPVNSVPVYAALPTSLFYLMARSDRNLNRDRNGGSASDRSHTLTTIDDIQIVKTNNGPFGENTVTTPVDASTGLTVPSKYRLNATNTKAIVWTPMAAATAEVQGLSTQIVDQPEKQGTLMLARQMNGSDPLRAKCAVELRSAVNS